MHLSGGILDYFIAFAAGIAVSFTPCVYPVMPITAGFIAGINVNGTKIKGFILSLLYVLGISITYSGFAIFAALSGKVFGQIQNNSFVFFIVSFVLLFFSLVMFDIIKLPSIGMNIKDKMKKRNVGTVILFGMATGLIVGPCTAPVLGTLLLYIASKQNIVRGIFLVFIFSYGVGASLILAGTFGGVLSSLPKSGRWLNYIKQLCGIILLIASIYYFRMAILYII